MSRYTVIAMLGATVLLILTGVAVVVVILLGKRDTRHRERISKETEKINALQRAGKISDQEASELRLAIGASAVGAVKLECDSHLKTLGAMYLVYGAMLMIVMSGLLLCLISFLKATGAPSAFPILFVAAYIFIGALGFAYALAGLFVIKLRRWARVLALILAVLGLASAPVGTALGIYALWALGFREGAIDFFTPVAERNVREVQ